MEQKEFKVDGYDYVFRTAKMNAVDVLSFQTQIQFDDLESATKLFNTILENVEVQCDNSWLPVKTQGKEIFYPAEVENDVVLVKKICEYFIKDFIKPVFSKSNESK